MTSNLHRPDPDDPTADRLRATLQQRAAAPTPDVEDGLADLARRIDGGTVPLQRPDRSRTASARRWAAVAAVAAVVIGLVVVVTTTADHDRDDVRSGRATTPATADPLPADETGFVVPRVLPDGWRVTGALPLAPIDHRCPCTLALWYRPDALRLFGIEHEPADPGAATDHDLQLADGVGADWVHGDRRVITWVRDGVRTTVRGSGPEPDDALFEDRTERTTTVAEDTLAVAKQEAASPGSRPATPFLAMGSSEAPARTRHPGVGLLLETPLGPAVLEVRRPTTFSDAQVPLPGSHLALTATHGLVLTNGGPHTAFLAGATALFEPRDPSNARLLDLGGQALIDFENGLEPVDAADWAAFVRTIPNAAPGLEARSIDDVTDVAATATSTTPAEASTTSADPAGTVPDPAFAPVGSQTVVPAGDRRGSAHLDQLDGLEFRLSTPGAVVAGATVPATVEITNPTDSARTITECTETSVYVGLVLEGSSPDRLARAQYTDCYDTPTITVPAHGRWQGTVGEPPAGSDQERLGATPIRARSVGSEPGPDGLGYAGARAPGRYVPVLEFAGSATSLRITGPAMTVTAHPCGGLTDEQAEWASPWVTSLDALRTTAEAHGLSVVVVRRDGKAVAGVEPPAGQDCRRLLADVVTTADQTTNVVDYDLG